MVGGQHGVFPGGCRITSCRSVLPFHQSSSHQRRGAKDGMYGMRHSMARTVSRFTEDDVFFILPAGYGLGVNDMLFCNFLSE